LSVKLIQIHFILLRVLFKSANINSLFLRFRLLPSNSVISVCIFQRFFWNALRNLNHLILLLLLLQKYLFFISINACKYLHLSSAGGCIWKRLPCIYAHKALFFKIVENFLLRLRIYTPWLRIESLCYPKSCFLFFKPIDCILATYFLILIFAMYLIHIKQIKAVSC
jgi:hypothetical protein